MNISDHFQITITHHNTNNIYDNVRKSQHAILVINLYLTQ